MAQVISMCSGMPMVKHAVQGVGAWRECHGQPQNGQARMQLQHTGIQPSFLSGVQDM